MTKKIERAKLLEQIRAEFPVVFLKAKDVISITLAKINLHGCMIMLVRTIH